MSEHLSLSIKIGGILLTTKVNDFFNTLKSDIINIESGPVNSKELYDLTENNKSINWCGVSNYAMCDNLCAFCIKNKMSYHHYQNGGGIYDNYISFWNPKIKKPVTYICSVNTEVLIFNYQIKKIIDKYDKDHSSISLKNRLDKILFNKNDFILPPFKIK
jgi:hypothetical protein